MITQEEAKKLLLKENISDVEVCDIIQRYIYDRKHVEIKINRPQDMIRLQLMSEMYMSALKWYLSK